MQEKGGKNAKPKSVWFGSPEIGGRKSIPKVERFSDIC
jgi:hypothetical protein